MIKSIKKNEIHMSKEDALKNHDKLVSMQQSEARLHWQRNNVFLVVSSILLLTISQFNDITIQIFLSIVGLLLNIGWFLIQFRSSSYIKVWKNEAIKLEQQYNLAPIFSGRVKGIQMRYIAYLLPILFIGLWIALIILLCSMQ